MRYFSVEFRFKTRPMYHKGRWKTEKRTFAADNSEDALRLAQADGKQRYSRRKWQVIEWEELSVSKTVNLLDKVSPSGAI